MKLLALLACVLSAAGSPPASGHDIIVVGWIHSVEWLDEGSENITAGAEGGPVYVPDIFGPGRTAWNLFSFDATEKEPYKLACSHPNGHVESWSLSVKRLKELGIPATSRYDNTHEEFYTGGVVGFDHKDPLVAFKDRVLRLKGGQWGNVHIPGWDENGVFVEVREDATIVLKELDHHVFEIARSRSGMNRTDLGHGQLTKAIGMGSDSFLVFVSDGEGEPDHMRLWTLKGATAKLLGEWRANGAVLASDGQIYLERRGGVDPTSRNHGFNGWTQLQPIQGPRKPVRITGDVEVSDVDAKRHRVWGVRLVRGHMGEPFIVENTRTHSQQTLIEPAINAVGYYERIAYVASLY